MVLRHRRPSPARAVRSPLGRLVLAAVALLAAIIAIPSAAAAAASVQSARIIGGASTTIHSVPWQVSLWSRGGADGGFDCGGAIIDAVSIVTAAHCVDGVALGADPTSGGLGVTAGVSHLGAVTTGDVVQRRTVVDARIHPLWTPDEVRTAGDLAVLELDVPLVLDGQTAVAAALPPDATIGEGPALVGAATTVSGYGRQVSTLAPTGQLFRLDSTVVAPSVCGGYDNAAALCAKAPTGTACSGDSGGPLVTRTVPPVLIGIVSNGPSGCPVGEGESYVNLATPENRRFLAGDPNPPIAPRLAGELSFATAAGTTVVVGQPLVCSMTFSGASAVRWTIADGSGRALAVAHGGTGATYWPTDADVGQLLTCEVTGSNVGGVAVAGPKQAAAPVTRPRTTPQVKTPDPSAYTLQGAALTATAPRRVRRGHVLRARVEVSQLFGAADTATICVRLARATPKCLAPSLKSLQGAAYAIRVRMPRRAKVGGRLSLTVTATLTGRDSGGTLRQVNRSTALKVRAVR